MNKQTSLEMKIAKKNGLFLWDTTARHNILYGGAGSSKSWSIAQHILVNILPKANVRILFVRKTTPALRRSCWQLMLDLLDRYHVPYTQNKTDLTLSIGGSQILGTGIDKPEKLQSIEDIDYIWVEEARELSKHDLMQLNLRVRGVSKIKGRKRQLFYSLNPYGDHEFLKPITESPPADYAVCHSTYKDNPFLDAAYIAELERLIEQDAQYARIYRDGLWTVLAGLVYLEGMNWSVWESEELPEVYENRAYGLDFGYSNHPTALIEGRITGSHVYEKELIYDKGLTNADISMRMLEVGVDKRQAVIIADSAEPKSIEELRREGWNIIGCEKGADSIVNGISIVKQFHVHVTPDSLNILQENRNYKWKMANDRPLNIPVDGFNHTKDAERYLIQAIGHTRQPEYMVKQRDQTDKYNRELLESMVSDPDYV